MLRLRLVTAIISTLIQEAALYVLWRWGLPQFNVFLPLWILITVMVLWGIYATILYLAGTQALRLKPTVGLPTLVGSRGRAITPLTPQGQVLVQGEIWTARALDGSVQTGEAVEIVGQEGMKLVVRKI